MDDNKYVACLKIVTASANMKDDLAKVVISAVQYRITCLIKDLPYYSYSMGDMSFFTVISFFMHSNVGKWFDMEHFFT